MGGAFMAVADDATATWWNPAGLASGAYFNGIIESSQPASDAIARPADAARSRGSPSPFPPSD